MPVPHRWSKALATDSRLSTTVIATGRTLALFMDATGTCFPGHGRISFLARQAERTVREGTRTLCDTEWLEKLSPSAPGRATTYRARFPDIPDQYRRTYGHRHGDAAEQRHDGAAIPSERRHTGASTPAPHRRPRVQEEFTTRRPSPPRRLRDPVFDALAEEHGVERYPDGRWRIPDGERGMINAATKQLQNIGATDEEIHERAEVYRRRYSRARFTPTALAKHWSSLVPLATDDGITYDPPEPEYT